MKAPHSELFTALPLGSAANSNRDDLPEALQEPETVKEWFGLVSFRGIPFHLGDSKGPNAIDLQSDPIEVPVGGLTATYVVFVHAVEDRVTNYLDDFADTAFDGNEAGDLVSAYVLQYTDGTSVDHPIYRRFAIQQGSIGWGASPFAAIPAANETIFPNSDEALVLGQIARQPWGNSECRTRSGRDGGKRKLWIYALPNPFPEKAIKSLQLIPKSERSAVYGIALTNAEEHPLRYQVRRKLLLQLPEGVLEILLLEILDLGFEQGLQLGVATLADFLDDDGVVAHRLQLLRSQHHAGAHR